jgi:hypothetical protein
LRESFLARRLSSEANHFVPTQTNNIIEEEVRLKESRHRQGHWKRWGPYLSERAWGTVREDYSPNGTAWEYLLMHVPKPIAGERMGWGAFVTGGSIFVSHWRCGMGAIRF